jgi:hypothetical protein
VNEDFLVGATSLKGMTGVEFVTTDGSDPWAGLLVEGTYRYTPLILEGSPGEVPDPSPVRDAFDFTIGPFVVSGTTRGGFLTNLAAVRGLFSAVNFVGTRRLTLDTTPFHVDTTANCRYGGLVLTSATPLEADCLLSVRNMDGAWS